MPETEEELGSRGEAPEEDLEAMGEAPAPEEDTEELVTCANCMNEITLEDAVNGPDDDHYCESCHSELFATCERSRCHECVSVDELYEVTTNTYPNRTQVWCESCRDNHASRCDDCNNLFSDNSVDLITISDYHSVCQSCYEEDYFTCDGCNEVFHHDDYGSDGYCQSCSDDRDSEEILDHSDGLADSLGFFGEPKNKIYFGVELEITTSRDKTETAIKVKDLLGRDFIVCKEDGSISDNGAKGFEIVTAPADLPNHRERWNKFFNSIPRGMQSWEAETCGMHVHVSRAPLSQLTIGKLLVFINSRENRQHIVAIAGRSSPRWCQILDKKVSDIHRRNRDCNRYQAINISNLDTIEFRIFRGTLKRKSFFKNLEFVAASVEYCRNSGMQDLTFSKFARWMDGRRKDYPALAEWLVNCDLLQARKPSPQAVAPAPEPFAIKA